MMRLFSILFSFHLAFLSLCQAQSVFEFQGAVDFELSMAGENSEYYWNGISKYHTDLRFGLQTADLLGRWNISDKWSLQSRAIVTRKRGEAFEDVNLAQLSLNWESPSERTHLSLGRFLTPFGSFYQRLLTADRDFIEAPLFYMHYIRVSEQVGYSTTYLSRPAISVEGSPDWGLVSAYRFGYTNGVKARFEFPEPSISWEIALIQASPSFQGNVSSPVYPGISTRATFQPTYFWKQGISFSHAGFLQEGDIDISNSTMRSSSQTMLGMDYEVGFSFWEFSGELTGVRYSVPLFDVDNQRIQPNTDLVNLSLLAGNLDVKYEPPFLTGAYVAYRFDFITYSQETFEGFTEQRWALPTERHSLALGYNLGEHILFKSVFSLQSFRDTDQNFELDTWRNTVTFYF
ncbi:MAG: hypothetical protein AAF824_20990 [Bacteroidota bacterium]